jgi:hypothetical protein
MPLCIIQLYRGRNAKPCGQMQTKRKVSPRVIVLQSLISFCGHEICPMLLLVYSLQKYIELLKAMYLWISIVNLILISVMSYAIKSPQTNYLRLSFSFPFLSNAVDVVTINF